MNSARTLAWSVLASTEDPAKQTAVGSQHAAAPEDAGHTHTRESVQQARAQRIGFFRWLFVTHGGDCRHNTTLDEEEKVAGWACGASRSDSGRQVLALVVCEEGRGGASTPRRRPFSRRVSPQRFFAFCKSGVLSRAGRAGSIRLAKIVAQRATPRRWGRMRSLHCAFERAR